MTHASHHHHHDYSGDNSTMKNALFRTAAIAVATTFAATGLVVATGTAAHAAGTVDVTAIGGGVVMSSSSKTAVLNMHVTVDPSIGSWYLESADVYRGSTKVGTASLSKISATQTYVDLKNSWGRGKFTLRNISINWYKADYSDSGTTVDPSTAGAFVVKGAIQGNLKYHNVVQIKVRGKKHTFKVGVGYLTPAGWRPYARHKLSIQNKVGSKWKTIKVVKLNSSGHASWKRSTKKKFKYRVITASTATTIGGKTVATRKL